MTAKSLVERIEGAGWPDELPVEPTAFWNFARETGAKVERELRGAVHHEIIMVWHRSDDAKRTKLVSMSGHTE